MALVLKDRVLETCTSPGTGSVSLLGAVTGYQTFLAAIGNTNTCYYTIADQNGANWEVGLGTYSSSGNTLARTTILSSSNGGSTVNFASGSQNVFVTYPSEKAVYQDASGAVAFGAITATSITDSGLTSGRVTYASTGGLLADSSVFTFDGTTLASPSHTLTGNLTFTGTGNRITGDFSNATVANRVAFQTSTVNGITNIEVIPNGTSTQSGLKLETDSAIANGSNLTFDVIGGSVSQISSGVRGTGTYLPMTFNTGGSERVRIDTSGNVGIGTSSPIGKVEASGAGETRIFATNSVSSVKSQLGSETSTGYVGTYTNYPFVIRTNDTERMRIDSSGNVGIGTNIPTGKLHIYNSSSGSPAILNINSVNGGSGTTGIYFRPYQSDTQAAANPAQATIYAIDNNYSADLTFNTKTAGAISNSLVERMRIDSSGNVGIGTSSPSGYKLNVQGGDAYFTGSLYARSNNYFGVNNQSVSMQHYTAANWNYSGLNLWRNASNTATPRFLGMPLDGDSDSNTTIGGYNAIWGVYDSSPTTGSTSSALNGKMAYAAYAGHIWYTNGTERMRINSSGDVLVGTTSAVIGAAAKLTIVVTDTNKNAVVEQVPSSSGNYFFHSFWAASTEVGYIRSSNGTTINYSSASDYRLKENIQPMQNALNAVNKLNPVVWNWKKDGSDGQGFIAHELQEIVPDCVTGEKDAVDADGNPVYQGIDTSFLVATLTAAIQELSAKVTELETKLGAK